MDKLKVSHKTNSLCINCCSKPDALAKSSVPIIVVVTAALTHYTLARLEWDYGAIDRKFIQILINDFAFHRNAIARHVQIFKVASSINLSIQF